ncbi:MAG: hypothetical protein Q8Q09_08685, partial [Deltaproteobacteria bacterium]|nr:hypothetical protein [Deltaproteobacteria bacterium]
SAPAATDQAVLMYGAGVSEDVSRPTRPPNAPPSAPAATDQAVLMYGAGVSEDVSRPTRPPNAP